MNGLFLSQVLRIGGKVDAIKKLGAKIGYV